MTANRLTMPVALMGFLLFAVAHGAAQVDHFHDKGKLPSKYTIEKQQQLRKTLPFEDKQDFEEQTKGFIAAPDYKQIMAEAGHVAWDMGKLRVSAAGRGLRQHPPVAAAPGRPEHELRPVRGHTRRSTRCAASIWPTSASSRATPAGSCSIR